MKKFAMFVVVLLSGVLLLSSCGETSSQSSSDDGASSGTHAMPKSFTEIYENTLKNDDLSTFERDVFTRALQNGKIAAEDYEEAFNRYQNCMIENGVEYEYHMENGIHQMNEYQTNNKSQIPSEQRQKFDLECSKGNTWNIEAIYREQLSNPELEGNKHKVVLNCFEQKGKGLSGYSADELENDLKKFRQPNFDYSTLPFDVKDDDINSCLKSSGIAINAG